MSSAQLLRERLVAEIEKVPEAKLAEMLDFIHYFSLGWRVAQHHLSDQPTALAKHSQLLLSELKQCIQRSNAAPLGAFSLDLSSYQFDRDEANER